MKKRSLFAVLLAAVMVFSMMAVPAFAAEGGATHPEIQDKIITVDSVEDLKWVSDYSRGVAATVDEIPTTFEGYTIQITADIENVGAWTPIAGFYGTMTGVAGTENGYVTISGLNVTVEGDGAGLCGITKGRPHFSNIKIKDSTFDASGSYAGAFMGSGLVSYFDNCHAENVKVIANRFVGGIVGTTYGNITRCCVTGSATEISVRGTSILSRTSGDNVGGIVGLVGEGNTVISGCTVDGITVTGARQVAGIAGAVQYGNTVKECTVKNSTIASVGTGILIYKGASPCAGGIVGQLAAGSDSEKISILDNTVENTAVSQKRTGEKYIGWAVGDVNSRLTEGQYVISGNHYIGTTDLNEVGYNATNPSAAN